MWSRSSEGSGETVSAHQMSTAGICLGEETSRGGAPVSPSGSLCVLVDSTLHSTQRKGALLQQVTIKVPRETQKWMVLNAKACCREREHSLQKLPLVSTQSPET